MPFIKNRFRAYPIHQAVQTLGSTGDHRLRPIFIHSLFRSGSTYLFHVFRRSQYEYWCYQEPLHELAFFHRKNPSGLNEGHGHEKAQLLRHPKINAPYFKELQETWPVWKDVINERIIYDAYFSGKVEEIGVSYWSALAVAADGRPVFQECRTSGRIGAIKAHLGGYHIYLWRNPWDQWWSYKVAPYFDVANQLIIHAPKAPEPVRLMIADLALPAYRENDLAGAFSFYGSRPLSSECSYLIFYMLWCLGQKEGTTHADLMLSIDRLSDSLEYREEMLAQLKGVGIDGLDFSDCRIPQGCYLKQDRNFFAALEDRVHSWLKQGGWTQVDLEEIQVFRKRYEPSSWGRAVEKINPNEIAEQAARARELARRFETSWADAEVKIQEAEAKAQAAEERAAQAEAKAMAAEKRAAQAEGKVVVAEKRAGKSEATLQAVYQSRSWRITRPLRELADLQQRGRVGTKQVTKRLMAPPLELLIRLAAFRPWVKRPARAWIRRHPRIEAHLLRFAAQRGLIVSPSVSGISANMLLELPHGLENLPPRACQIYAQLKAAIEQKQKENG